jgi:nitrate reductase alpha subunit
MSIRMKGRASFMRLNRRKFLQVSAGVATAMALTSKRVGAQLKPVVKVGNPL